MYISSIALGIGIVFIALVLIANLICLSKFIPMIANQNKLNGTTSLPVNHSNNAEYVEKLSDELVNDSELVAVITAAIMASMGVDAPEDGLVVKSIKRANVKRWQSA